MFKIEEKILNWIEKNLLTIIVIFGVAVSLLIRFMFKDRVTYDAKVYLSWYDEIKSNGGFAALDHQVGDYSMLFQFIVAILTYIPIKSIYAYKILFSIFDYILAYGVSHLVYMITNNKKSYGIIAFFCVVFSPIVFLNSSCWAQNDVLYTVFIIYAIIMLSKEKYIYCFVFLGIALSLKMQTVLILPFFLFIYFAKKKFTILYFALIPITLFCTVLPSLIAGRSIMDVCGIYGGQAEMFKQISLNYPSFWNILFNVSSTKYNDMIQPASILITMVVLSVFMILWTYKKVDINLNNMIYMAFILTYTCVLFLPHMHERYSFLYEIFAIIIVFKNKKTIPLIIALYCLTLFTYGSYLFQRVDEINVYTSVINISIYSLYVWILLRDMYKKEFVVISQPYIVGNKQ